MRKTLMDHSISKGMQISFISPLQKEIQVASTSTCANVIIAAQIEHSQNSVTSDTM